ncbi:unnamed protein product [Rotaria sp. Silwood1]|nr:unnamed protein product [Rotaria sp. Silwood1]CAF1638425.1 unnamed protein product [Rotaria sp. Silwood1]
MGEIENEKDIAKTNIELLEEQSSDPRYMTSPWADWSPCNVKCGNRLRTRTRIYKNADHHGCNERLSESEMCYARTDDNCDDEHQQVALYSSFSPCSVSYGQGTTERRRWYISENSHHDPRCKDVHLIEKRQCHGAHAAQCDNNGNKGYGQDAIQTRTRIPIRRTRNSSKRCGPLKETRYCQTAVPC